MAPIITAVELVLKPQRGYEYGQNKDEYVRSLKETPSRMFASASACDTSCPESREVVHKNSLTLLTKFGFMINQSVLMNLTIPLYHNVKRHKGIASVPFLIVSLGLISSTWHSRHCAYRLFPLKALWNSNAAFSE